MVPNKRDKSKRNQKRAEKLHHPCIIVGPQQRGQNRSGLKRGRKCYITPSFSGVPNRGDKIKAGPKEGGNATSPLHSRGYPTKGTKSKGAQKRAELLHHPGFSGIPNKRDKIKAGPKEGGNTTSPLHSRGSPTNETKSKGAQKRAERLHHSCILGDPQQTRQNESGIKRGRKSYISAAFLGIPNKRHKSKAGPKEGGNATSPLHSRGSPTNDTKSKRAEKRGEMLHHPCILRGPHQRGTTSKEAQKSAEMLHHPCILGDSQQRGLNQSGPKMRPKRGRKCYITPAFSGVPNKRDKSKRNQKRAEKLHHPCILGDPQQRGQNQSGLKRGPKCYITLEYSGIRNKGDNIKAGPKEGGNATSPWIFGDPQQTTQNQSGPKKRRKYYITRAFSGVPNKRDKIQGGPTGGGKATSQLHSRGSPPNETK